MKKIILLALLLTTTNVFAFNLTEPEYNLNRCIGWHKDSLPILTAKFGALRAVQDICSAEYYDWEISQRDDEVRLELKDKVNNMDLFNAKRNEISNRLVKFFYEKNGLKYKK